MKNLYSKGNKEFGSFGYKREKWKELRPKYG
jgi:hypothetical protein